MDHKEGKWATQILEARHEDGMWGVFHTLSCPVKGRPITTEQAIRRLHRLGYTIEDKVIKNVVERMVLCITDRQKIDNYFEKTHDWQLFEKLMLSAWIRIFEPQNPYALEVARGWADIVEKTFASGTYCREDDIEAFTKQQGRRPRSGFETGFGMFYHAVLLQGVLTPKTEHMFLDYYLSKPDGMYYIYDRPLNQLPEEFASKAASCYLAAMEVLAGYEAAKEKLSFVVEWLNDNKDENGQWDFGPKSNDGVYFPLSDSWRKAEDRKRDCTERVNRFLNRLLA